MIKEFFAKLIGYENMTDYNKRQAKIIQQNMRTERELAKEREQMNKQRMHAEGMIPRIDTDQPSDSSEKHDQAA